MPKKILQIKEAKAQSTVEDFDFPPPIPLDALLNPYGNNDASSDLNLIRGPKGTKYIFGTLLFVFAIVLTWFFINENSTSSGHLRIKGIMPIYLDKLQEMADQKTPGIVVGMALSLDGKTLFASTNKDGEILSIITLKSVPKRILGTSSVELMVRGVMKNQLGEFSRMQLTKGEQFVPGEYAVEFTGRKMFFLNRYFKSLNGVSFFKKLNTTYNYQTTALIYAGTPREFEKKMSEYKDSITNEILKPYNDKLERIMTFKSLLNKTMEEYLLTLEKIKKPKDILAFEKLYIKEMSPIVQSLVIAANEISKTSENEAGLAFKDQVLIGKNIGELASDMITDTAKLKKITEVDKSLLKSRFEVRYKNIKSDLDLKILKLQDEIQKASN
jgi:hypothetical protein